MSDGTMNTEVPISADGVVYHIMARAEDIADNILLVGDPGRVSFVSSLFDEGSIRFEGSNREICTATGTYNGTPVTCMSTGMGTDNVEIVMTEIHILKEYDVKTGKWTDEKKNVNIIRCGTCGCPQADVNPGSLAITQFTIGLDNTGKYYSESLAKNSRNGDLAANAGIQELTQAIAATGLKEVAPYLSSAHSSITDTIAGLAASRPRPYEVGHTASAPGFYACQGRKVGRLSDIRYSVPEELAKVKANGHRVVNIEMECSSLCHIGHMLGYRCGAVCVVLANRAEKGALLSEADKKASMIDCVKLALDTFVKLSA